MRANARALLVFFAVFIGSAGCDHASKRLAVSGLSGAGSVSVAGDAIQLRLTSNTGAFLSLGAGLPEGVRDIVFIGVVPLLVLGLCVCLLRSTSVSSQVLVGLGLLAGGGFANWLDRLLHGGAVTDFLVLGLGPLRTGIFNVADVAVVAGVAVLFLARRRLEPAQRGQGA